MTTSSDNTQLDQQPGAQVDTQATPQPALQPTPRAIPAAVLAPVREHVDFVVRAVDAHDAGYAGEIVRCAVALRALLHSPLPYLSLLARAEGLHGNFLSTALPQDAEGVGRYGSLVITAHFDGRAIHFCALDSAWYGRWLKFSEWWNEPVFINEVKQELSRRDLVLAIANKDAGTSLDPALAVPYARLSAYKAVGITAAPDENTQANETSADPITNPERAALRQVAHEALRTLIPTYRKFPQATNDPRLNTALAKGIERPPSLPFPPAIRRNDTCPCGSGKKLKYCHGAIA